MKLFIDPADMKAQYQKSPDWLKKLMNAYADGLNYYLYKHPQVKPRVITRFEPWMALSFSEGSIGGDIERVNLNQLEAFYGAPQGDAASRAGRGGTRGSIVSSSRPAQWRDGPSTPRRIMRCC
jgi:acyl-homoserine-lactone acylase